MHILVVHILVMARLHHAPGLALQVVVGVVEAGASPLARGAPFAARQPVRVRGAAAGALVDRQLLSPVRIDMRIDMCAGMCTGMRIGPHRACAVTHMLP